MPGYYVHLASTNHYARQNRSFVCGVESLDLLKNYFKSYGIDGARDKYNLLKTPDMPDFSTLRARIEQKESKDSNGGLHYGVSSNPNVILFWNSLTHEQKKNPFYIGYLWHLLTDLLIYKHLDIDTKIQNKLAKYSEEPQFLEMYKREVALLHGDWDKTNALIRDKYPDVLLPSEITELGIVKFISNGELCYINWNLVSYLIEYLRQYNPLDENIDNIIANIMNMLPGSTGGISQNILERKRV